MSKFQEFCSSHEFKPIDCKAMRFICDRITKSMAWDEGKTVTWFETENPLLGGVSPVYMVKIGRIHKLVKFVDSCLSENADQK